MRTKSILFAAALAASAIPAVAQNVYSLNVVGYVNVVLQPKQFTCINTPLKMTDYDVTNLFPASLMKSGCYIQTFDTSINDFAAGSPTFYGPPDNVWDPEIALQPGVGYFFWNSSAQPITNTFVGEVIQGSFTNNLVGHSFNMIGSSVPLSGNFTNAIAGLTPTGGDYIQVFDGSINDWAPGSPNYYGPPDNVWDPADLNIAVGQGFFYYKNSANTTWVRSFTVPQN